MYRRSLCVSLLALFVFSCGIPTLQFFLSSRIVVGPSDFTVTHNSGNNTLPNLAFYGYQLYYKLYKVGDTDTPTSDRDYLTEEDRVPSPTVLNARRFRRIKLVEFNEETNEFESRNPDDSVFTIDSSSDEFILNFTTGDVRGAGDNRGNQAKIEYNSATYILHRPLRSDATTSFFGTFSFPTSKDDDDIKSMIPTYVDGEDLEVLIAILPRGLELSSGRLTYGIITVASDSVIIN